MAINLRKGEKTGITSEKFTIGLKWQPNNTSTGAKYDLDASVFMIDSTNNIPEEKFMVFYGNAASPDSSVNHTGDNQDGNDTGKTPNGYDEEITVDTSLMDSRIEELRVIVTIHDAIVNNQNFGQVQNSLIELFDTDTKEKIAFFELDEEFSVETAVEFGRIYKKNGEWKFDATGNGQRKGLDFYVNEYAKAFQ